MEDLAEGLLRGILKVIRVLISIIWEGFLEISLWYIGWPVCRMLAFGQYPRCSINEQERETELTKFIVSIVGFFVLIAVAVLLTKYLGAL